MKNKLIWGVVLCLLWGCHSERKSCSRYELKSDAMINQLSDSSFFNSIACMQEYGGEVYFSDKKRGQIMRLDTALNLLGIIGRQGNGPKELGYIEYFVIADDTLYVGDGYKQKLVKYQLSGEYVGADDVIGQAPVNVRFAMLDGGVYYGMPMVDSKAPVAIYDSKTHSTKHFGDFIDYGTPDKNMMQNSRSVFVQSDELIMVPSYQPKIERCNVLNLEEIEVLDLADCSQVEGVYRHFEELSSKVPPGFKVVIDCYLHNELLYLLYPTLDESGKPIGCSILEFDVSLGKQMVLRRQLVPDDYFLKFCVTDGYVYGFVPQSASIKRYPLPATN